MKALPIMVAALLILGLLLVPGRAAAFTPVAFSAKWSQVSIDPSCSGVGPSHTITVSISPGMTVLVMAWWFDSTANTNMATTFSDNGGNVYTQVATHSRANFGTQDVFENVSRSLRVSNSATTVTIAQANPPACILGFAAVVAAYTGVASFGGQDARAFGSTTAPFVEVPRTESNSWIAGLLFAGEQNQAPGSMNAGTDRGGAGGSNTGIAGRIMLFDNVAPGGVSGGGHDCAAKLCVLPNFSTPTNYFGYGVEMIPQIAPVVTTDPVTGISETQATLHGTLTDVGAANARDFTSWTPHLSGTYTWQATPAAAWLNDTDASGSGWAVSPDTYLANFDVWAKIERPLNGLWVAFRVLTSNAGDYGAAGQYGYLIPWYTSNEVHVLRDENGAMTDVGFATAVTGASVYLRVIRTGSTYAVYYGMPGTWTLIVIDVSATFLSTSFHPGVEAQSFAGVKLKLSDYSNFGVTTIKVRFDWGGSPADLTNHTPFVVLAAPASFSAILSPLGPNTTLYFRAYAEDSSNASRSGSGATVSFTTTPNVILEDAVRALWIFAFVAALALILAGAYWVKKKRSEG